jgi:hypothetical protein
VIILSGDLRGALTEAFLQVDSAAHQEGPQSLPLDMAGCCVTICLVRGEATLFIAIRDFIFTFLDFAMVSRVLT